MIDLPDQPSLTFPTLERKVLEIRYSSSDVILEYGSGGSTILAASMPGKYVISVESDRAWAVKLQQKIDTQSLPSPAIVWHSDIGPTGEWGRPIDATHWHSFHKYPTKIWTEPFFREPDIVLIDGRFRAACFAATFLRIKKPTKVLFDDYVNRKSYHIIEKLAEPSAIHGRMAEFMLYPGKREMWMHDLQAELVSHVTFANLKNYPYKPTS